jgi:hypothetical protein
MKKLLIILFLLASCSYAQTGNWELSRLDTGRKVTYLSDIEKDVLLELNKVRTNPKKYAEEYLVPMRKLYSGKFLRYPDEIRILTDEGVKALDECIKTLQNTKACKVLIPFYGLSQAARYHQLDQGKSGNTGHTGSDGKSVTDRIEMYGHWSGLIAEDIDYGSADAGKIVISLLIDDGVKSRGHRRNILNSFFECVGIAAGEHSKYKGVCVIDFAQKFTDYVK